MVIILFLSGLGIVAIQSAGSARESTFYRSQIVFVVIGWLAYWAVSALDYRHIQRYARRIYLACLAILLPVSICAILQKDLGTFIRSVYGARRWMDFGPFSIQPSEFAKLAAILLVAEVLARFPVERPVDLLRPATESAPATEPPAQAPVPTATRAELEAQYAEVRVAGTDQ